MPEAKENKSESLEFLKETRKAFQRRYEETHMASVLIAQIMLEGYVERKEMSEEDALKLIHNGVAFADFLLKAEDLFQKSEHQKLHGRMSALERNTDWKPTSVISLATGTITGIVFTLASPFVSTLLQPTADELFGRKPAAQNLPAPQPQTTSNTYNFNYYASETKPTSTQPAPSQNAESRKSAAALICGDARINAYQKSLAEHLSRGETVTVEVKGKKASICYRPVAKIPAKHSAFSK